MTGTYVTDITHYLDESGNLAEMPSAASKLASFLVLIIDATSLQCSEVFTDTEIPCRSKGCFGEILSRFDPETEEIIWHCPNCGHNGIIRHWQKTKWDQRQTT